MPIQIGGKPLADFTQPIRVLYDCHGRIERFLGALLTVSRSRGGEALDERHRSGVSDALHYFEQGAPLHTADEEVSLFPRLRSSTANEAAGIGKCLSELEIEHRYKGRGHRIVHRLATSWLEESRLSTEDAQVLRNELERLELNYGRHIRTEEDRVFPVAAKVLSREEMRAIASEMKARRQR